MTIMQRLVREPALIMGLLTAVFGALVVFGVDLTKDQIGAITLVAGALITLIRFVVTPAGEVVASQTPGDSTPKAGPAAPLENGTPVQVSLQPVVDLDAPGESGALTLQVAILIAVFGGVILMWLLGAFGPSPLR